VFVSLCISPFSPELLSSNSLWRSCGLDVLYDTESVNTKAHHNISFKISQLYATASSQGGYCEHCQLLGCDAGSKEQVCACLGGNYCSPNSGRNCCFLAGLDSVTVKFKMLDHCEATQLLIEYFLLFVNTEGEVILHYL
jgi:hypothetical protein